MRLIPLAVLLAYPLIAREPLAKRIVHTDPTKYSREAHVHEGAGEMQFEELFDTSAFDTNLLFLHRGVLPPKAGIGHHYHNQMEEMFVILDNEAQFTIDGRTSTLAGPAGAPCRMGRSHGIYNQTDRPTQWMNIAVASLKGKYDNFDLGDFSRSFCRVIKKGVNRHLTVVSAPPCTNNRALNSVGYLRVGRYSGKCGNMHGRFGASL
jgi:uncharacterized cupin superfamily protein